MSGPDDGISGDGRARKVGTDERGGNLFVLVRATKKSSGAFQQLVALIQNGHFKRGDKLPPERDVSADFHISRQTMREALYRAELLGLIEVRHGAGSFVLSRPSDDIAETPPVAVLEKEAGRIFEAIRKKKSETARQRIVDHMDFLEAKIKEDMENIRSS